MQAGNWRILGEQLAKARLREGQTMLRKHLTAFCFAFLLARSTACFAAAPVSDSASARSAKAAIARLNAIIEKNQSLTFSANVTVSIKTQPGDQVEKEQYALKGEFQHPVYVRFDEIKSGATILTIASNPQHLYLYSPVTHIYLDCGNVPVYFAVWDMLTSGGTSSDKQMSAGVEAGYFFDIWGYFGGGYGLAEPWGNVYGEPDKTTTQFTQARWKGRPAQRLMLVSTGKGYVATWVLFLDPKSGLPMHATLSADGPPITDIQRGKSHFDITEDYTAFTPSQKTHPESDFAFTPPPGAKAYPEPEDTGAPK
ncbi:MAG TPA: hypothetical protein VFW40_01795 [Capsulimonadaceae bacterium]|nr:hypothetical protein [Capsulimonadaceae bacterium]